MDKKSLFALAKFGMAVFSTLSFSVVLAQAIYRSVGPDGKVTFSDKPPLVTGNASATNARGESLPLGAGSAGIPYELRQISGRFPVTLYTAEKCAPCGSGRSLLISRGIPFTERTVNSPEDYEALQRITGENTLPILTVGGQKIKGFSDAEWTEYLNAAGYPKTSALPAGYKNAPAIPLVALQRPATPSTENTQETTTPRTQAVPAARSNPAGIKF